MAMGEGNWGLTEAAMGLVVPASMIEMARYSVRRPVLEKLLYAGQAYPAFKAREMGVIDELLEGDELLARAEEVIEEWTPVPAAFGEIKTRLKAPTVAAMDLAGPEDSRFVERWFSPDVQERVGAVVAKLKARD
jgi:enoyl-CoA hydratase/carnithine racemase